MNTHDQDYKDAKYRVRKLRHFYGHLTTYVVVIAFLHIVNLLTSSHYWAFWPALGWGIAIALHAIKTTQFFDFFGADWEERQIQKIMQKKVDRGQTEGNQV